MFKTTFLHDHNQKISVLWPSSSCVMCVCETLKTSCNLYTEFWTEKKNVPSRSQKQLANSNYKFDDLRLTSFKIRCFAFTICCVVFFLSLLCLVVYCFCHVPLIHRCDESLALHTFWWNKKIITKPSKYELHWVEFHVSVILDNLPKRRKNDKTILFLHLLSIRAIVMRKLITFYWKCIAIFDGFFLVWNVFFGHYYFES